MRPFDLQKAIEGHPLVTRDGRHVQEFHYFEKVNEGYPIVIVISGKKICINEKGKAINGLESQDDIFLAPTKIKKWINIYNVMSYCGMYKSKEEALKNIFQDTYRTCIATIEIEFEDNL